jgi:hypothetical protein
LCDILCAFRILFEDDRQAISSSEPFSTVA